MSSDDAAPISSVLLADLTGTLLGEARVATAGRAAQTLHGGRGHTLQQLVVALAAGRELAEHSNPGEATLQVLRGRVRLITEAAAWEGGVGELATIPPERHSLIAVEDCAVLLTISHRQS